MCFGVLGMQCRRLTRGVEAFKKQASVRNLRHCQTFCEIRKDNPPLSLFKRVRLESAISVFESQMTLVSKRSCFDVTALDPMVEDLRQRGKSSAAGN